MIRVVAARYLAIVVLLGMGISASIAAESPDSGSERVKEAYPLLTTGFLAEAKLSALPSGILLQAGTIKVTSKDLDQEISKAPGAIAEQLKNNQFLVLDNLATSELILAKAKAWEKASKRKPTQDKFILIGDYLQTIAAKVTVTDAEIKVFYEDNKELIGDASFDNMKDQLKQYVMSEKQQKAVDAHIAELGAKTQFEIDKSWLAKQYQLVIDNPVDKARISGKPSFVDFSADNCNTCNMMKPILESVMEEYADKGNMLKVDVSKAQVLAARYNIQAIPAQVFFDKDGKEVFRHIGFFAKEQIIAKLADIGVK